jgi:hypothetical protein
MMPMPPGPMGPPPMRHPMPGPGMGPPGMTAQPMGPSMAPPSPLGPMGPGDMSAMPPPMPVPDGLELYGNPVLDGPTMPVEALFPDELGEQAPLDAMCCGDMDMGMGMPMDTGMPGPGGMSMNPDQVRASAQAALAGRAKARMGASQSFQSMANKMSGQGPAF